MGLIKNEPKHLKICSRCLVVEITASNELCDDCKSEILSIKQTSECITVSKQLEEFWEQLKK